jgi:hypothetical protein
MSFIFTGGFSCRVIEESVAAARRVDRRFVASRASARLTFRMSPTPCTPCDKLWEELNHEHKASEPVLNSYAHAISNTIL